MTTQPVGPKSSPESFTSLSPKTQMQRLATVVEHLSTLKGSLEATPSQRRQLIDQAKTFFKAQPDFTAHFRSRVPAKAGSLILLDLCKREINEIKLKITPNIRGDLTNSMHDKLGEITASLEAARSRKPLAPPETIEVPAWVYQGTDSVALEKINKEGETEASKITSNASRAHKKLEKQFKLNAQAFESEMAQIKAEGETLRNALSVNEKESASFWNNYDTVVNGRLAAEEAPASRAQPEVPEGFCDQTMRTPVQAQEITAEKRQEISATLNRMNAALPAINALIDGEAPAAAAAPAPRGMTAEQHALNAEANKLGDDIVVVRKFIEADAPAPAAPVAPMVAVLAQPALPVIAATVLSDADRQAASEALARISTNLDHVQEIALRQDRDKAQAERFDAWKDKINVQAASESALSVAASVLAADPSDEELEQRASAALGRVDDLLNGANSTAAAEMTRPAPALQSTPAAQAAVPDEDWDGAQFHSPSANTSASTPSVAPAHSASAMVTQVTESTASAVAHAAAGVRRSSQNG